MKPENCIGVIFGAYGDLSRRKLMPSIFNLFQHGHLPDDFAIIGVGKREHDDQSFRQLITESVDAYLTNTGIDRSKLAQFEQHLYFLPMDHTQPDNFGKLKRCLADIDAKVNAHGNYIYYLATAPSQFQAIAENLGSQGLQHQEDGQGWKRIIIEKPFGYDLDSARKLNQSLQTIFQEDQIYRIDHYLGKETVQNILAFRFANGIFEPLWNGKYIHHVEVTAAESLGIGERGNYYDGAGALRDMVQNHLLQVVATIAMEPPSKFAANAVRNEKVKVFESLRPITGEDVCRQVVRGQYSAATIRGESVFGYRDEKNVPPGSKTETFVALKFFIDNWRWGGVPFYIRTGKRLPTHVTEAAIHFKKTPHYLFTRGLSSEIAENQLILRIQPDEGILLKFGLKMPGAGYDIKTVDMDFHYSELSKDGLPDAYERLLLDCALGDATLYARADAVEACWSFLTPILDSWKRDPANRLYGYPAGTWGPKEASQLFEGTCEDWRYPCKNLSNDGEFCEL